jgi:hypothetical protein
MTSPDTTGWPRGGRLLRTALLALLLVAAGRLAIQVPRLVAGPPADFGAVDLGYRFREIQRWFAGEPVYGALDTAVYPPATYALLWPFLGWTDWGEARLLWAATALPALLLLAFQCAGPARERGRATAPSAPGSFWWLAFLLPLSFYATGVTLGAGQMLVHLLPLLIAAVLLLARPGVSLPRDLGAAGLLTLGLAKPNAAAPFLWLAVLLPVRLRPLALTAGLYLGLTVLALSFQPAGVAELFAAWRPTATGVAAASGSGHLPAALAALGLARWQLPAALLALLLLGLWLARHRAADPWVLLGVTGIAARVWSYHQYYDDLLVLPALIAVLRLAFAPDSAPELRARARQVFTLAFLVTLLPTPLHYSLRPPWDLLLFDLPQMLAWAALLSVLAVSMGHARRRALGAARPAVPGAPLQEEA